MNGQKLGLPNQINGVSALSTASLFGLDLVAIRETAASYTVKEEQPVQITHNANLLVLQVKQYKKALAALA